MSTFVSPKRIGMLTPSSNTVIEPYTSRLFMPFMETVSVHYARFKVTGISLSPESVKQFDHDTIMEAAHRLAEASVDCIAWSGTAAAWLGMEQEQALCRRITEETGIRATSTMAAFAEAVERLGAKRLALITPYTSEIQDAIIARYQAAGFEIVHDTRLEDQGNFSFATYPSDQIKGYAMSAAESKPDAILIVCTNFRGAPIAAEVEAAIGIPVIDSVSITAWQTLRLVGEDPSEIMGWGSVFAL
ncbi:aspartate/glutamate racemase family protein [Granulosicoccus antarcticus]|uniref:Maleate isomerase n=1 Tax=Granulosicoccus antarcticus IMCC3135 TaxID=1192854 RepID=A0A2Z2NXG1_9GAMM|nr:aspartate/glutamate racemase family protein [Granulosicoccus antarcticus]ASJ76039.1 Maleate isomerase [Granulosicoccus antarcticus IMCC3135]